jgi:hypothetical protein
MAGINSYTKLLLHGNGTNHSTTFTDDSPSPHSVSSSGAAEISTTQSKFGGASISVGYGFGTASVTVADSADWNFGTGNFTIDFWMYFDSEPGFGGDARDIIYQFDGSDHGWGFWLDGAFLNFGFYASGESSTTTFDNGGEITYRAWHHIAVTRSGTNMRLFIDGTLVDTKAISSKSFTDAASPVTFADASWPYFIDEFRIQKGEAVWTSSFTPATSEYAPDAVDVTVTPSNLSATAAIQTPTVVLDSTLRLLLHGDGTNGSTTITDDSQNNFSMVDHGSVQISTAQSKFGGASILFNGTTDYVSTPAAQASLFDFGTNDFTIDCWVYMTNVSVPNVIVARTTSGSSYFYWQLQNGTSRFADYNSGYAVDFNVAPTLAINTWYHAAITRKGSKWRMFLNGVQVGSTYSNANSMNNRTVGVDVGAMTQNGSYYMHGYIDELRIYNGYCKWTTNFTVPSAAWSYSAPIGGLDSNVVLMAHMNGSDTSTTFTDNSPAVHTLTAYGNAQIDTAQSKFSGASGLFDGSGDYVGAANSTDWNFGTGDFTIDFWVRRNGSQGDFVGMIGASPYPSGWELGFGYSAGSSTNKIRLTTAASGSWGQDLVDPDVLSDVTWHHVALVRYGNILTLYVDGVGKTYANVSGYNYNSGGQGLTIGKARVGSDSLYFNGWLDEVRVSKGIARWDGNFDVPTAEYSGGDVSFAADLLTLSGVIQTPNIDVPISVTVTPSNLTGTFGVQAPTVSISISTLVSLLNLTGGLQEPFVGQITSVSPSLFSMVAGLQNPTITISSSVLPTTLVAHGSLQSPTFPGLFSLQSAKKIISFNPLVVVTDTNPLKIGRVNTTDPNNPIIDIYEISGASGARDVHYDSIFGKIYIACDNGVIVELDASDFNTYTLYSTGVSSNLTKIANLPGYAMTFTATDDADGEIVVMDESVQGILSMDVRFAQEVKKFLSCQVNTVHGALMNLDMRFSALVQSALGLDIRFSEFAPTDYVEPISRLDFHVYINGVEVPDVKMDAINIYHSDSEKSRATFTLARQHDNLDYTLDGVSSQITNQNAVRIEINGHVEFEGFIWTVDASSEQETVQVTAYSTDAQTDERSLVTLSVPSINEQLNLHHALVHNPKIENPYILADDPNPSMYKGIFVPAGYDEKQNVSRWSSFQNSQWVAESVSDGSFVPKQNWTYFWFATAQNFITGTEWGTLNYIGTSPTGLTGDTWEITGMAYKYQRKFDSTKTRLGTGIVYAEDFRYQYDAAGDCQAMYNALKPHGYITYDGNSIGAYASKPAVYAIMEEKIGYRVGSAPYKSVSCKAGRLQVADQWEDRPDGMYVHKDESYDYRSYAMAIANLELRKLQNINGSVLPKTSADIEVFLDAYYHYNIRLLKRLNVDNTTRANIYKNNNGFPVSVKSIDINSSSMKVTLRCDNQWSRLEQLEIEGTYPISDDYVVAATDQLLYYKFDPRTMGEIE